MSPYCTSVILECVEAQIAKAKEILGRAKFGVDWQTMISNWNAESKCVAILDVCAGLPLAFEMAGSGVNMDNEDTKDG